MEDRQELRGEKEEHGERRDLRGKSLGSEERMEGRERTRAQVGKRKRGEHSGGAGRAGGCEERGLEDQRRGEGGGAAAGRAQTMTAASRRPQVSVCQEMLQELRHAVSCRKTSRSRRRRRPGGPSRALLSLRAVREMRLSNGKLYSAGADAGSAHGGPQRLLDDPGPPGGARPPAPTPCTHVRVCQECRRIQALRASGAGAPPRGLAEYLTATMLSVSYVNVIR